MTSILICRTTISHTHEKYRAVVVIINISSRFGLQPATADIRCNGI